MIVAIRDFVVKALASPSPEMPATRRLGTAAVVIGAVAAGAWIFAFKMQSFLGLATTSDLYDFVQLSTSWLHGRFLHDNYFGNALATHTFLFCPILGILAFPLGATGLLLAVGIAVAFSVVALVKILRLFAVPTGVAWAYAMAATMMPLSVHLYADDVYGFHVELLAPVLALWLTYFLLKRRWLGSVALAVALLTIKEDSPLIAMTVAATVLCEDIVRTFGSRAPRNWRRTWNRPAIGVILLSGVALPLLLYLLKSQPVTGYSDGSFQRLHPVNSATIAGGASLISYVAGHAGAWLHSPTVRRWLAMSLPATFGLILLRPHLLIFGVVTTLISWLMQDDLLMPYRFAQSLAFYQVVACLAFASAVRIIRDFRRSGLPGVVTSVLVTIAIGVGVARGLWSQLRIAPKTTEVYRLAPTLAINPADRRKADLLFAIYRRESRRDDPVIASDYLFRYADDRNLFWYNRLRSCPKPMWILWDQKAIPLSALWAFLKTDVGTDRSSYTLLGQAGRFLLYRVKPGEETTRMQVPGPTTVDGELYGQISMKVQLAARRAGMSEPILSLGSPGNGDLFFVRYLNEHQLELGMESVGASVHLAQPVEYEPGRVYELELFSGSLLPPKESGAEDAAAQARRLYCQNLVSIRWDGREVLNTLAPAHAVRPNEVYTGYNFVRSGSAISVFTGEITDVHRGGYPESGSNGNLGAVRMVVALPPAAAGVPEPLVVIGEAGQAVLGYVRVLPDDRIKVGAEFWGVGAYESEPVSASSTQPVEIVFSFPALYPPTGDPRWGDVPRGSQEQMRTQLKITVNGAVALRQTVAAPLPRWSLIHFGENPVGGSLVSAAFTGRLLLVSRLPLSNQ